MEDLKMDFTCYTSWGDAWIWFLAPHKPGIMIHNCNLVTWEVETGGLKNFKVILSYRGNWRLAPATDPISKNNLLIWKQWHLLPLRRLKKGSKLEANPPKTPNLSQKHNFKKLKEFLKSGNSLTGKWVVILIE